MSEENEKLGLVPRILGGGVPASLALGTHASEAIGRLVGGLTSYPVAWLRRASQSVDDVTDARSIVMRGAAEALRDRVVADPEILDRMAQRIGFDELRKQENIEATVVEALSALEATPASDDRQVDDDFLDRFKDVAGKANSDEMRQLFGRVLAGEIREPRSFSYSALNVLSMMDKPLATALQRGKTMLINGRYLLTAGALGRGSYLNLRLAMEDSGVLSSTELSSSFSVGDGRLEVLVPGYVLRTLEARAAKLGCVRLTGPGEQVMSVVPDIPLSDEDRDVMVATIREKFPDLKVHRRIGDKQYVVEPLSI